MVVGVRYGSDAGRGRGFTLIELLVVVAIIALLIGILVPALSGARSQAKKSVCMSNMKQICFAMQMYMDEHNGRLPEVAHGLPPDRSWINTLKPWINNVNAVRICPSDPRGKERLEAGTVSYVLNEYVVVVLKKLGVTTEDFTSRKKIPIPSRTILAFEGADDLGIDVTQDHAHSRKWFTPVSADERWQTLLMDIQPDRHVGRANAEHKSGPAVQGYVDGHVEVRDASLLWLDIKQETNFAKPPQ